MLINVRNSEDKAVDIVHYGTQDDTKTPTQQQYAFIT